MKALNNRRPEPWKRYPHGSGFYAYSHCALSWKLSQAAGPEPATADSRKGTIAHALLSGKTDPDLAEAAETDPEASDTAAQLWAAYQEGFNEWAQGGAPKEAIIERRLWFRVQSIPLYSGQPDRFERVGDRVFLADWKTGWQTLDAYPATNSQLRAYVPLIDQFYKHKIDEITAQIFRPGKQEPPAVFGREEIDLVTIWARDVAETAFEGRGEPNPGPWCRYCAGKVLCPAWKKEITELGALQELDSISDAALAALAPKLELAAEVVARLRERLFERVRDNPLSFPGWHIEPGEWRRTIPDTEAAYRILVLADQIEPAGFLAATRVSLSALKTQLAAYQHISLSKADQLLESLLSPTGALTKSQNRPQLVYQPELPL